MKSDFLTRDRHLSKRVKGSLFAVAICGALMLCFYPIFIGLFVWISYPTAMYQSKKIHLPVLWVQEQEGRLLVWSRPPHHAFSQFGYEVISGRGMSVNVWRTAYGNLDENDLETLPALRTLLADGMICGSVKRGTDNDQIAFGCLDEKHNTSFDYSGSTSGVSDAVRIIHQIAD